MSTIFIDAMGFRVEPCNSPAKPTDEPGHGDGWKRANEEDMLEPMTCDDYGVIYLECEDCAALGACGELVFEVDEVAHEL